MYAVVESGGKQYKVEKGTSLLVDRLDAKEGDKVALRAGDVPRQRRSSPTPKELEKVKVEATVAEHLRGPKIKVFKYKAEEGLPPARRPPLRADQARGDRGQAADPQSRRPKKPAEKKAGEPKAGGEEARREEARRAEEAAQRRRRPGDGS